MDLTAGDLLRNRPVMEDEDNVVVLIYEDVPRTLEPVVYESTDKPHLLVAFRAGHRLPPHFSQ